MKYLTLFPIALWLIAAPLCWSLTPNRLVGHWPGETSTDLVGWGADGSSIIGIRAPRDPDDPDKVRRIQRFDLATGQVSVLRSIDNNLSHSRLSPDGQWIAIYHYQRTSNRTELFNPIQGRSVTVCESQSDANLPMFRFSPRGQYLAFRDAVEDGECLRVVSLQSAEPKLIFTTPKNQKPVNRQPFEGQFAVNDQGQLFFTSIGISEISAQLSMYDIFSTQLTEIHHFTATNWLLLFPTKSDGCFNVFCPQGPDKGWWRLTDQFRKHIEEPDLDVSTVNYNVGRAEWGFLNWLPMWIRSWLPLAYHEITYDEPDSGRSVLVDVGLTFFLSDSQTSLDPDSRNPSLAVSDSLFGIRVWDAPPRRSIPGFLIRWLIVGAGLLGFYGLGQFLFRHRNR